MDLEDTDNLTIFTPTEKGKVEHLTKPFEHEALMKSLRAVLGLTD